MKKLVSACIFILAMAMTGNAISFAASSQASKTVKTVPAKAPSGKITPVKTKAQTALKPVQNKATPVSPARAALKAPQVPKNTAITGKPGSAKANAKPASVKAAPVNKRNPVPPKKKALTPQTAKTIKSAHRHVKRPAPVMTEPPPPPDYIYQAYAVADAATGAILEGENIDMQWPPASVTKIMFSCIILEKVYRGELRLNERVYVSKTAAGIGGTQVYLKAGESFTLEEMMRAVMIQSANDAAHAVAEHVAGSADAFVRLMNRKAAQLGMTGTVFGCVHGLPPVDGRRENLTTCRDLIRLAREALRYPKLREWTSVSRSTFRRDTTHIHSKNKLLETMPGIVDGLKTGFYRKAGYNIVATGRYGGKRILVVVLGSPTGPIRNEFAQRKLCQYLGIHQEL